MKQIIVFSGGMDSTVLLLHALAQGHEVQTLSVNYGQRHKKELEHAALICEVLGVKHHIADLSGLRPLLGGSSQTDDTVPVPEGHYEEESMKLTVVPNRNMMLLAVAGALAISTKSDAIAYAAHAGDHAVYPDCREEFVRPLGEALRNADWHLVQLLRPFLSFTKAQLAIIGSALDADRAAIGKSPVMHLTYSCYNGRDLHCGKCGTCVERREAFALAKVPDPTQYEQ